METTGVFSAGTIAHAATLDLEGLVKLGRKGGLVAFSVRENRLGRYDEAIGALRARAIWTPVERFRVEDGHKETSPHIVLIERVTDDRWHGSERSNGSSTGSRAPISELASRILRNRSLRRLEVQIDVTT